MSGADARRPTAVWSLFVVVQDVDAKDVSPANRGLGDPPVDESVRAGPGGDLDVESSEGRGRPAAVSIPAGRRAQALGCQASAEARRVGRT